MKSLRGRGWTRSGPVGRLENRGDIPGSNAAAADLDQRADDRSNHVLEEPVRLYPENPLVRPPVPAGLQDISDPVFRLGGRGRERCEVMAPYEQSGRKIDRLDIELMADGMDVPSVERGHDRRCPHMIFISLRLSRLSSMELEADFLDGKNTDVWRQQGVHAAVECIEVHRHFRGEIRDLTVCVHARISTSRAVYPNGLVQDATEDFLEPALDCRDAWLELPAVIVGPVVRDGEFQVAHQIKAPKYSIVVRGRQGWFDWTFRIANRPSFTDLTIAS